MYQVCSRYGCISCCGNRSGKTYRNHEKPIKGFHKTHLWFVKCIGNTSAYHAEICGVLLQYRCTQTLAVDIHPAATIGKGVLLDHGTGLVIGETAVVGNNVSILHNVTLGGASTMQDSDLKQHDRHAAALSMLSL